MAINQGVLCYNVGLLALPTGMILKHMSEVADTYS